MLNQFNKYIIVLFIIVGVLACNGKKQMVGDQLFYHGSLENSGELITMYNQVQACMFMYYDVPETPAPMMQIYNGDGFTANSIYCEATQTNQDWCVLMPDTIQMPLRVEHVSSRKKGFIEYILRVNDDYTPQIFENVVNSCAYIFSE